MKKLIILISIFLTSNLFSQNITEFEKNLKQNQKKGYNDAVVIFDKGVITHNLKDYKSSIFTHIKVKVFSKKGIDYYKTLNLNYNPETTKFKDFKAYVYLPDGSIKTLTKENLNKKEVSREYGKKEIELNIAFPGLVENSILEYSFTYDFDFVNKIEKWNFQHEFPVIYSEIKFVPDKNERFGYTNHLTTQKPELKKEGKNIIISSKNIEPFEVEKYTYPADSLKSAMYFYNLTDFVSYKNFWIESGNYFASRVLLEFNDKNRYAKKLIKKNFKNIPEDKLVESIYNYILDNYLPIETLTEKEKRTMKKAVRKLKHAYSIRAILKLKYVPSFYMNIILANLVSNALPDAKIKFAYYKPFYNGFFNERLRTLDQLTDYMIKIEYKDKVYWLDISKRLMPFGMTNYGSRGVPILVCGSGGAKFEYRKGENYKANITDVKFNITVNDDETSTVTQKITMDRHKSFQLRKILNYVEKDKVKSILEDVFDQFKNDDIEITNWEFENLNNIHKPLILNLEYSEPFELEEIGENLLLNLKNLPKIDENPFKLNKRKFPVIFPYPYVKNYTITYHLPSSLKIKSLPKNIDINKTIFAYSMNFQLEKNNGFTVKTCETLERNTFKQTEINFLYNTFNKIMKAMDTKIIIEEL